MKILILASNPRKDLNLDDEIRLLRNVIDQSRGRDQFEIVSEPGVRVGDLQRLLLRHQPQIVHFCGHGGGKEGLIFKMDGGGEQWVRAEALATMFGLNPICTYVQCVLLNACYSEEQANAIVSQIDYVVGMSHEIQDNAAIAFSKGFYLALGEGCSIEDAFEFGRNAIQLEISGSSKMRSAATEQQRKAEVVNAVATTVIPEHLKPILKRKPNQRLSRTIASSESTLSQAKREEIQVDVARVLTEKEPNPKPAEKPGLKQFRVQVREYLQDHKLVEYEKDLLNELRKELGLSIEETNRILEEEQLPIRQAQQAYEKRLIALIKYYPFNEDIKEELKRFQTQRNLTDEEVSIISQPILNKAEAEYQKKLNRTKFEQAKQKYEQRLHDTIQQTSYPLTIDAENNLKQLQRELGLTDIDVEKISKPLLDEADAIHQEKLRIQAKRQLRGLGLFQGLQPLTKQEEPASTQRDAARVKPVEPPSKISDPKPPDVTSESWHCVETLTYHEDKVNAIAIDSGNRFLVSGSADSTVKVWHLLTGELLYDMTGHVDSVNSVAISADNSILATASSDKTIKIWSLTTGKLVRTLGGWFTGHTESINAIALSPDNQILVSGSRDHSIKLWELSTGKLLNTLPTASMGVYGVAISPDGRILASDYQGDSIQVRDLPTQAELRILSKHTGWIWSLAISPDSRLLASGSQDSTVKLWDLATGKLSHTLQGHSDAVRAVAFSPDGRTVVSGSYDRTLKLWDLRTKNLLCTLAKHSQGVNAVAFSLDGYTLASGSDDHTVKIWKR